MARSRNIKPGFFKNEELAAFPAMTRLLFAGLWTIADKSGRLEDRPRRIKAEVFPFDDVTSDQIEVMLSELASGKEPFIIRYVHGDCRLIQVVNWEQHQTPYHRERDSVLPPPTQQNTAMAVQEPGHDRVATRNRGNQESGIRNQESVTEGVQGKPTPTPFDAWWQIVHHKTGRGAAEPAYAKAVAKLRAAGRDDPHEYLLDRMLAFARSPNAKPPDRTPIHPATWLNQARYDDDPETWNRTTKGPQNGRRDDIGSGQRHDPATATRPPSIGWND